MKAVVESVTSAPPDVAHATNIDISRWPEFIRGITRVEILTDGPIGVGTRFRETRTMFGREAIEEMTVAALESPHRQVFTAENHGARYVATTDIIPEGSGSRLRLTFEGIPVTLAARLLSFVSVLMMGQVRKQLQNDLDDVAAEAARRATSASGRAARAALAGRPQTPSTDL